MSKAFSTIERKRIYSGKILNVEKHILRAPNGKRVVRELIQHNGAAVIVPVLSDGRFVMVYQHRVAVKGWILEFPAGTLEPGESPRTCALRETVEEVGYRPGKLVKLVDFFSAPGISTERMHIYLAGNLKRVPNKLEEDEFLKVRVVSENTLRKKIERGLIKDGKTIVGFFYYLIYGKQRMT